ncbi:uncharacterized protein LOC106393264 [Brassica napus]|uniref:uncharacterized protein LOC106393264 n=1 Tax=Brassica napus TaxID=3708 RepID=UPI0006AAADE7|nr:uncharacterized protein LOC106393264 [Brassica napus]
MTLIMSGRLLHQYVVDVYSTIEEDRLRWTRNNQDVLRAELYSNVCDAVGKGDTDARTVDLFITMTANPNWKEIKDHLATYNGDNPNDRPDIECRVFKMKLDQLLDDFKKGTFFAPYTADNASVIPHNIEILKKYAAHINVE